MGLLSTFKKMKRNYKKATRTLNKIDKSFHPKKTSPKTVYNTINTQKDRIINYNFIQGNDINGSYDFSNISPNEADFIYLIKGATYGNSLNLIANTEGAKYKHAAIANRYIELRCENMNDCNSVLATAIACKRQGANKRKKAIEYYEKFISIATKDDLKAVNKICSLRFVYSDFSKLYESEHDFDKSLKLMKQAKSKASKDTLFYYYENMARIYSKIDINKCIDFINDLKNKPPYDMRKDMWDSLYKTYKEKQDKGYVFKPRSSNYSVDENLEKQIDLLASRFL